MTNSRIAGFYKLSIDERLDALQEAMGTDFETLGTLLTSGLLTAQEADKMVENVVATHNLPLGIGLNFKINGVDRLVPMVIEEPSVVAGASFMAKLARKGGGFFATTSAPEMIGQIQILDIVDIHSAKLAIYENREDLLAIADDIDPILKKLGGGARDLEVRVIEVSPIGEFLVLHLIYDVRDAMGANAVNTACEKLAPHLEKITGGRVHLKILSNLSDRRMARVRCVVPVGALAFETAPSLGLSPLGGEKQVLPHEWEGNRKGADTQEPKVREMALRGMVERARKLRKNTTDVEEFLWQFLRRKQINDVRFRRQHPHKNYILDFYSYELKLAIELDGSGHLEEEQMHHDGQRTKDLNEDGIQVLRFWNSDAMNNIEMVLGEIWEAIEDARSAPSLSLSPLGGEKQNLRSNENEAKVLPPQGEGYRKGAGFTGEEVRDGIIEAYAFAASDPYRAATHNKGIMNGVDAVVIATGNDWRAIEAGAHAYAARDGKYTSLSTWGKDDEGNLVGTLEMPMAVGIVGGATKVHPTAQAALKLMQVETASELAEIIVSVGLAQNLAALRALATEGIQRGHMSLHARQVAIAAGASGEMVEQVAAQMVAETVVRIDRAEEILKNKISNT
jgi:hydroxymethylglutaryl-CoA reductase/very-short-patch-repair endonuclease